MAKNILGCVIPYGAQWGITQPRKNLFAVPCTYAQIMQKFETEQFNWAYKENYINHEPSMSDIVPRDDVHMQKFDT